ncbi:MAG: ATP-binding protein [Prevotella sp.]|nr:ATP-binding protein [Prevotella sp.]
MNNVILQHLSILYMILSAFTYKQASGWRLDELSLNCQNLIVGMNSVGKSRTVSALGQVARFIRGEADPDMDDFECSLLLENGSSLEYSFEVSGGEVQAEILRKSGIPLIMRERYSSLVYGEQVSPPAGKLVIQVRRDTMRYPEIEEIIKWAEHTSLFVFSNITTSPNSLSPYVISKEPLLPVMYGKMSEVKRKQLLAFMHDLGYEIDNIKEYERVNGSKMLHVYERGINLPLTPFELSNGMFRVFCVLLYMIYCTTFSDARCLIIDDMGEGLDYFRSTRLGKIMFGYCEENHIQLLATSNDSFLMDAVDLHYWNILQREGNRVYSLNNKNSRVLFERFVRTGLSNFDLLSSNFIANNSKDE